MSKIRKITQSTEKFILRRNSTIEGAEETNQGYFKDTSYKNRRLLFQNNLNADETDSGPRKIVGYHSRFNSNFPIDPNDTSGTLHPFFNN